MAIDKTSEDYKAGKTDGIKLALGWDLSPTERLLVIYWMKKKTLTPQAAIAQELGLHRSSVPAALTSLVEKGFLVRQQGKPGTPTVYASGPYLSGKPAPAWTPKRKTATSEKTDTSVSEKAEA